MHARHILAIFALSFIPFQSFNSLAQSVPSGPQLHLHRGTFDAQAGTPVAPLREFDQPAPGPYVILQFSGPIHPSDRLGLESTGVDVLEYLPDFAYLVRGTPNQLNAASELRNIYAMVPLTKADKLAPSLLRAYSQGQLGASMVRVYGWPGSQAALDRDLAGLNLSSQPLYASPALISLLAGLESVRWIEPAGQPRLVNDHARGIMQVDPFWQRSALFGAGQVIAVTDTGLDTGNPSTLSPDFTGRIVATPALVNGETWDDDHGHGTHVTGSIAGAGVQSGANPAQHLYSGSFAGIAPEASLVIQAFEATPAGEIIGLDPDYYTLFQQAYDDGARLHSDSWGDLTGPITDTASAYGGYPFGAARTDAFLWDHPDMSIFVAAGNSGKDGTPGALGFCSGGNGVVDPDSLLSPGTAKNVITVGATESDRSSGGYGGMPWLLISLCFAAQPIATDTIASNPAGMAAFSSRGPSDDGRIKPDIVAPGTNIVSNVSHVPGSSSLWGFFETNSDYAYSGGTSMATPLAAGAGVLVRQWLAQKGLSNPSAAAVKATLLNTTTDIAPGQYGTVEFQEIPLSYPNHVEGWGRVNLDFTSSDPPNLFWLDDRPDGLSTLDVVTYTSTIARPLEVLTDTLPLRAMLVWTDPPASLSAASQLVNDLDLTVTGPDGTVYHANGNATFDRTNNVEGVVIDQPLLGQYTITVSAFNVPIESQPYALAVWGPLQPNSPPLVQSVYLPMLTR